MAISEAADRFRTLSVLPDWLMGALSGDEVMTALTAEVPECQAGLLAILGCKVKRLALQGASGRWAGSYHVQLRREAGGPTETVQLSGSLTPPDGSCSESTTTVPTAFGEPGWECWLPALGLRLNVPPAAAESTQLAELLEPARAALLVQEVLRAVPDFPPDVHVRSCTPRLLGHKPGNRSVVRCDVDLEGQRRGARAVTASC